jgi:putative ATP-binding cassette transporter
LDYEFTNIIVFGQVFFYTLLTAMIFILPIFDAEGSKVVVPLTAAALFLIGPLGEVVGVIPYWSKANVAVDNLKRLETLLEPDDLSDDKQPERSGLKAVLDSGTLREICCEEAVFSHLDRNNQRVFTIGPLKLCLKAGEVVFVVGGNGSGKSTFLKLLAGLYQPQLGRLVVNGDIPVDAYNSAQYREFFSAIFSEFHLFDRLYGLPEPDSAKLLGLLQKMQLQDKTDLRQGQFTNLDLSTGQRKRMALLVALLEDRPVFLFDEVAADQDPEFRRYFYETILSELKARGKTVVVVTHDDRYFSYGDRVLKMEFGRFVETP